MVDLAYLTTAEVHVSTSRLSSLVEAGSHFLGYLKITWEKRLSRHENPGGTEAVENHM